MMAIHTALLAVLKELCGSLRVAMNRNSLIYIDRILN